MRDIRNHRCGNLLIVRGGPIYQDSYAYVSPYTLTTLRDPRMRDYFAARLRGERPQIPTPVKR